MSNGFPCVVFNGEVDPDAVSINFWSDASALVAGGSMSDIVGSVYLFVVASGGGASLLLDRTGDVTTAGSKVSSSSHKVQFRGSVGRPASDNARIHSWK